MLVPRSRICGLLGGFVLLCDVLMILIRFDAILKGVLQYLKRGVSKRVQKVYKCVKPIRNVVCVTKYCKNSENTAKRLGFNMDFHLEFFPGGHRKSQFSQGVPGKGGGTYVLPSSWPKWAIHKCKKPLK